MGSVFRLPEKVFDPEMRFWYLNHNKDTERKRFTLLLFDIFFWLSLSIALAGPGYAQKVKLHHANAKTPAILVALDVSASMNAEDIQPSRLLRAKNELLLLIDKLEHGQRLGLVLYTARPHLLFQPTADKSAQRFYINLIKPNMLPFAGSDNIGAIQFSHELLHKANEAENSHIVLISDGDTDKPIDRVHLLDSLDKKYKVSVIGMGTDGQAAIPATDGESQWMRFNNAPVFSSRNDFYLEEIASIFSGTYLTVTSAETKLGLLIDKSNETILDNESRSNSQWIQLYHPFLFLAGLLFFTRFLLQRE